MISALTVELIKMRTLIVSIMHRIPWLGRMDHHMQEVVSGATASLVLRVLGMGLSFLFNVFLARMLGAKGTGVYYLALSVTGVATVVSRVGLDNVLLRFVAIGAAEENWGKVAGVYSRGLLVAGGTSAAVACLIFMSAPWAAATVFSEPSLAQPLQWMALTILPTSLLNLHAEMLRGLKKIRESVIVQTVAPTLINIIVLGLIGRWLGVMGAVIANVTSAAMVLSVSVLLWRQIMPQLRGITGHFEVRELLHSSMPLFWVSAMGILVGTIDILLLGVWASSETIGFYSVAKRLSVLTSLLLTSVNSIAAPKYAALYIRRDMVSLGRLARSTARLMTLTAVPVLLIFVIFPSWPLSLFGRDFVRGSSILAILAVGEFVNVSTGSVGYLLIMTGHERSLRKSVFISLVVDICLQLLLIPRLGAIGAALASSVSLALQNLLAAGFVYQQLSIVTLPITLGRLSRDK